MQIKGEIDVNAPVEKVFTVFSDLNKATGNISSIKNIEVIKGSPMMEIGTRWRETRVMFGQEATEEMEVSKFEKNKMYEVVAESSGAKYRTVFSFTSNGDKTHVEMLFEGIPVSFAAKLMSPLGYLFKGATQRALQQDLIDLKAAAER